MQAQYLRQTGMDRGLKSLFVRWILHRLRQWDVRTANGVNVFIANSRYVARRIHKVYRRDAIVVHPPVDIDRFSLARGHSGPYLVASRLVPYKRVDLVVEAFIKIPDRQLIVVGDGSETARIRAVAKNAPNITFRGAVAQDELVRLMQQARAVVFAAEEDFGIAMVEAQACGAPVIAFGRGGALDILDPEAAAPTGCLFPEQTAGAIVTAVHAFEGMQTAIAPEDCRRNAERFSRDLFRSRLMAVVGEATQRAP
jgi:glycosyltransferase involved in cell wall biosynthesis